MIHGVLKSLNLKGLGFFCVWWYLLYLLQPRSSRKYRWGYNPFFPNYTQKRKPNLLIKKAWIWKFPLQAVCIGGWNFASMLKKISAAWVISRNPTGSGPQRCSLSDFKMKRLFNLRHKKSRIVGCGWQRCSTSASEDCH